MTQEEAKIEVRARIAWGEPRANTLRFLHEKGITGSDAETLLVNSIDINEKEESSATNLLFFIPSGLLILVFWPLAQILALAGGHASSPLIDRLIGDAMLVFFAIYPIIWMLALSFSLIAYGLDWPPKLFKRLCRLPLLLVAILYLVTALGALTRRIFE